MRVLVALLLLVSACAAPRLFDPARIDIPSAYGIEAWDRVEGLRFTIQRDAYGKRATRRWVWEPKSDTVTAFDPFDAQMRWRRSSVPPEHTERDRQFEEDLRWLIFPLSLAWDTSYTIVDRGASAGPIGGAPARWIQALEPGAGLLGPGYDLYVDEAGIVREWVVRGADGTPLEIATWSSPVPVGPLRLSLDHFEIDGTFRISFPEVAVKLQGSDVWVPASR